MRDQRAITIRLTSAQVAQVTREASGHNGSLPAMFAQLADSDAFTRAIASTLNDGRLSHSHAESA